MSGKLAFIFPGQGAQYVGMGRKLAQQYPAARQAYEEAGDTLGFDVAALVFEGDEAELTRTENTQPALLTASVAAFRIYMEEIGIQPAYAAGHSLGEFSALTTAGVLDFADALRLVRLRGQFMQEAASEGTGAMCAVTGVRRQEIEDICRSVSTAGSLVAVSNRNSPRQTVISGHRPAVELAGGKLAEKGARVTYLKVSAPFHSPLMAAAARKLERELAGIRYGAFAWPVISNVTGLPYEDADRAAARLTAQMTAPVLWEDAMLLLERQGVETAVELGPGKVLTNLMADNAPGIRCFGLEDAAQAAALREHLRRHHPLHRAIVRCLAAAVCTRNRNWDEEAYRVGVIEPYRRLQQMQESLDAAGAAPSREQAEEALELLRLIFRTKQVPPDEQQSRLQEIAASIELGGGGVGLRLH